MGQIWPRLTKSYYRFNAENRVHRYLDKNKFTPSPVHPTTAKYIENLMPDEKTKEALLQKNEKLDHNLKQVYIKSFDPPKQPLHRFGKPSEKMRKLPVDRSSLCNLFSYLEPEYVPKGKLTLRQAMQLITSHQEDPQKANPASLSQQYQLPISDIENILTYFGNFNLMLPEPTMKKTGEEKVNYFLKKTFLPIEEKKDKPE